jgi:hypothetical protein
MKVRIIIAGALLIAGAASSTADEYYVVLSSSVPHCMITTSKPVPSEIVTQIGPNAFRSREQAEARIRETKMCEQDTVGTTGSTTRTIDGNE